MANYQTTPLAQDNYSRLMAELFDDNLQQSNPTGFLSIFGRAETGAETLFSPDSNAVEIDIIRANGETIAPLVPRGTHARMLGNLQKNVNTEIATNVTRVYPYIKEELDINASQLSDRLPGESTYAQTTRQQRLQAIAGRKNRASLRRIIRTFEYLASQSVLTGKMPAIIGTSDPDLEYDFLRTASHQVTLITQWTNPAADILADIDAQWDKIREDAYVSADAMLLGSDAMNAVLADADVKEKADNRRFELIMVNQNMPVPPKFAHLINAGMTARGRLLTPGGHEIWMFTYEDVYTDLSGTTQKYMPAGKVVIFYSGARCDRYFGPPETLPMIPARAEFYRQMLGMDPDTMPTVPNIKNGAAAVSSGMFYFDAYATADWSTITARVQAAPIFATTQTDAFVVIENAA